MSATNDPDDAFGTVLLRCRFRPLYAVSILIAGTAMLLVALDGLFWGRVVPSDGGSMSRGALGVLLVVGALAAGFGASQLLRPTVFVEATDRGLVLHRLPGSPAGGGAAPRRFLVPWARIRGLDYEVHALPTGIPRARARTIAVRLLTDAGFAVPEGFNHLLKPLPGSDPAALYVDAGSGSPGGRELLRRLEELRTARGGP